MRYYIILFFSVLSFLYSCKSSGVPDDLIPTDQMTALLTQVYLADGSLSNMQQLPDTLYKYGTAKYAAIFKKFNIDTAQFRKSYIYYASNPQKMLDINIKILAVLQTRSDSLTKIVNRQRMNNRQTPPVGGIKGAPVTVTRPMATFHPGTGANGTPAGAGAHPASTFHPGSAGGFAAQPATVLEHGKVVQVNQSFSHEQHLKATQAAMKAKRDSLNAKQHK